MTKDKPSQRQINKGKKYFKCIYQKANFLNLLRAGTNLKKKKK